jgi:hypothetical protein
MNDLMAKEPGRRDPHGRAARRPVAPFYPGHPVPVGLFVGRPPEIDRIMPRGVGQVVRGKPIAIFVQGARPGSVPPARRLCRRFFASCRPGVASEPGIAEVISRQLVRLRGTRLGLHAASAPNREI